MTKNNIKIFSFIKILQDSKVFHNIPRSHNSYSIERKQNPSKNSDFFEIVPKSYIYKQIVDNKQWSVG
jgi:hypothetical protein